MSASGLMKKEIVVPRLLCNCLVPRLMFVCCCLYIYIYIYIYIVEEGLNGHGLLLLRVSRVMRSSDNWCSFWIVTPIYVRDMLITVDWCGASCIVSFEVA